MSLDNLPVEWFETTLEQIAEWGSGGTPSRKNSSYYGGDVPWIKTGDLGEKYVTQATEFITDEAVKNSSAKFFKKGSVIMAMYGATIGKTSILGVDATTNQACAVGTPIATSTEFLYYFLRNEKNSFIAKGKGGAQPNISQQIIKAHTIYLPSLAEQQEIVRQLDSMLAQVEQIKARLDAIPAILKKFRQSVLADAVSGKLINQDFSSLGFLKLESLILDSGNGLSKRKGDSGNEVTVLRLADFKDAQRVFGNERSILLTEKELLKYKLLQNDILVVRVNGSVDIAGKFILHKDNEKDEAYCDHFIRLRIDQQKLLPEYLLYIANEGSGRDYLVNSLSTSAGQNTINQASIKGLQLRVPEIKYQDMIIQTVEKLFKHSFKIEETVLSAQKRVNLLTQSILAKAFSGELTAEWREQHQELITGINSAESLLAAIQAEREASKPAKKTRKKKEV
ncbi:MULTISPECIES: restriction endonuclease subunit S [unclassified Acinetobacter]|uniref:restriction endonuclease subunit S n=1 Tax=unclassified Acinetobacter TaxID=196816 RepID=UPI00211F0DF8|nr:MULTISPECIES: restriction endonuclease subunit S [unclassified Acinetobacter]